MVGAGLLPKTDPLPVDEVARGEQHRNRVEPVQLIPLAAHLDVDFRMRNVVDGAVDPIVVVAVLEWDLDVQEPDVGPVRYPRVGSLDHRRSGSGSARSGR